MTVKDLIEILSKQNPDAELTVTKKTWEKGIAICGASGHYEYDTDNFELVKISSTDKKVDFCY